MAQTTRARSPNYPNLSLPDALARVRRVFDKDRRAPLDREVVARHMGYSGLSGASDKTIASIMQYGLLQRVAKGEIQVSQLAMDIFHPDNPAARRAALFTAGFGPNLFRQLRERFPDSIPSSDALRTFLVRQNFLDRAIQPVIAAYTETCQFLAQEDALESGGVPSRPDRESVLDLDDETNEDEPEPSPAQPSPKKQERRKMDGERTLLKGILSSEADFEVLVSGPVGVREIERLIKKLEFDKEILADRSRSADSKDD